MAEFSEFLQLLNSKFFISSHHLGFRKYAALYIIKMFYEWLMQFIHWFVLYYDYAYLIRLCDVTQPTLAASNYSPFADIRTLMTSLFPNRF